MGALHLHVIAMGSLAVDQVRIAVRAYANWDEAAARTVLERERAINAHDDAVDEEQLARTVILDEGPPPSPVVQDVGELGQRAESLLRRALEAFDLLDAAQAGDIAASDQQIDRHYDGAMERLLTRDAPGPGQFKRVVHAAFVLKSIERIGDHARNLARLLQADARIGS